MTAYAGIFDTEEQARTAFKELVDNQITADAVLLLDPAGGPKLDKTMEFAQEGEYLLGLESRVRTGLQDGKFAVLVKSPMGWGTRTLSILQRCGADSVLTGSTGDGETVSEFLGIPLLLGVNSQTKLITERETPLSSTLGLPLLANPKSPRNSSMGLPLLISSGTPLSSMLGLPLLTKGRTGR